MVEQEEEINKLKRYKIQDELVRKKEKIEAEDGPPNEANSRMNVCQQKKNQKKYKENQMRSSQYQ